MNFHVGFGFVKPSEPSRVLISVIYTSFVNREFLSFLGKELGHIQENIGFTLWRDSNSLRMRTCQRKIDPNIEGSSSTVESK